MSADLVLHKAIYDLLRGDSTLRTLLAVHTWEGSPTQAAIYDHVPQVALSEDDAEFPLIAIGDYTAVQGDTDDVNGQEFTLTLHVYDKYEGTKRVKAVVAALYAALHEQSIQVSGHSTIYCYWEFSQSVPDPEPKVQHAATRFRIFTQA